MKLSDAIKAIDYDPSPDKYPFEFRGEYHGTTSLLFAIGNEVAQLEDKLNEIARIVANKGIAPEHKVAPEQLLTIGRIALGIEDTSVASSDGPER